MSFLIGDKVILRPVEREDLGGLYGEWINLQSGDTLTQHAQFPSSRRILERYMDHRSGSPDYLWLAIVEKESSKHIGNIELYEIDWVHRKAQYATIIGVESAYGKGYGLEASRLLLGHAFGKFSLNRIELGVHENNAAARALYQKLGFVGEGLLRKVFLRDGKFSNLIRMGLLADDFDPVRSALVTPN